MKRASLFCSAWTYTAGHVMSSYYIFIIVDQEHGVGMYPIERRCVILCKASSW
jgi:hypothetical protein